MTNIGTDHLGEYGVVDLEQLAAVKLIVGRAVRGGGTLIANADDPVLAPAAARAAGRITWLSVEPDEARLDKLLEPAWIARADKLGPFKSGEFEPWVAVDEVEPALGGAAVHNIYNALGALALGSSLGLSQHDMLQTLRSFQSNRATNPGRGNLFELGGVHAYADFAHNPEGLRTVLAVGERFPAGRRLLILGQAGDRDDSAIDALADVAAAARPDRIVIKQMREHLRGREPGTVVARLRARLHERGYPAEAIAVAPSETEAVRQALSWAQADDLLFLLLHAQRKRVLDLLEMLVTGRWSPGDPIPPLPEG